MAKPGGHEDEKAGADPRSLARLHAVQALYQIEMTGIGADAVVAEFEERGFEIGEGIVPSAPDRILFGALVVGAAEAGDELDRLFGEALSDTLSAARGTDRLEALMKAILRCGIGELKANPERPVAVILNEYVEIAHAFYDGREPALINGVLDHVAKALRNPKS